MPEIGKLRYHPNYRIGTEQYNGYLLDLFTGRYYDNMVLFEDDLEKEAAYGKRIWKTETELTPEELLCTAVIGQAVVDFLTEYYSRNSMWDYRSIRELRDEFRHSIIPESVVNELVYLLRREWRLGALYRGDLLETVKRSYSRFMNNIGKTRKGEKKHG